MNLTVTVNDKGLRRLMAVAPKEARRALEIALDKLAFAARDRVREEMPRVFERPTPYTLNSLRVEKTRNHNMQARVWFKEPDRMTQHYLVAQVEGGPRRLKGFERALGNQAYMPSRHARLDRYGNLPYGQIVQILSVLGRAEYVAGYSANITARSAKRNRKPRDFVLLPRGTGKLPPGVYQRIQTGRGFGAKTKRHLPFGEYQRGRTRGRFSSAIRARGLRPVLIKTGRPPVYRRRLPFHALGRQVVEQRFEATFSAEFRKLLGI